MFDKREEIKFNEKEAIIATVPNYQFVLDGDGEPGYYITIIYLKEAQYCIHRQYPEPHEFPKEAVLLLKGHYTAEDAEKFHNETVASARLFPHG